MRHDRVMTVVAPYARTIRQAAHDAVHALLAAAPDSPEGSAALRDVTVWLARELPQGPFNVGAVADRGLKYFRA